MATIKSIEEKAHRYDEALKEAVVAHKDEDKHLKATLERIFPELKESEDEKIRKEIIEVFKSLGEGKIPANLNYADIFTWLEKQGEQIDLANKEYWRGYREGKKEILDKYAELEKQGVKGTIGNERKIPDSEQKPTDKVKPKFKVGDRIYLKPKHRMPNDDTPIADTIHEIIAIDDRHYRFDGSFIFIEDQDKFELVEQKPAWSEEDEEIVETLNEYVKNLDILFSEIKIGDKDILSKEFREKVQHWLKSLKERMK